VCYRHGGPGKRFLSNAGLQQGKGAIELFILVVERKGQRAVVALVQKKPLVAFVLGL